MLTASNIVLLSAALTTALITGLLYGYSCSVNPGLGKLPAEQYIAAMQSINREIQNPLFFVSFMGAAVLLPVSCFMHYHQPLNTKFWLLLVATIIYVVGVIGVTAMGNIPLNNALDKFNATAANAEELNRQKLFFMQQWNRWHNIRTVAAMLSLVGVLGACVWRNYEL